MKKPSMTSYDVMSDMRKRGFSISQTNFIRAVEQGIFPFVKILGAGETGRRSLLIFRKEYEAWADEFLGDYKA